MFGGYQPHPCLTGGLCTKERQRLDKGRPYRQDIQLSILKQQGACGWLVDCRLGNHSRVAAMERGTQVAMW